MIKERSKRIPVELSCWIEGESSASCLTIYDLSETGLSLVSSDPLPEGKAISLKVYTPFAAEAVTLRAEVVWSRTEPEAAMGLQFLDIDEKTRGILKGMVRLMRMQKKDLQKMVSG